MATGQVLRPLNGKKGLVFSLTFSPDGKTLASGDNRGSICLWDVATGRQLHEFTGHEGTQPGLCFFELGNDGKIALITDFWPEPYELPASRADLVERY